jgi:phosphoribosyl-AMP cyclohydrolase
MNRRALELSLSTGLMHYWSKSRRRLWMKGETSGHRQRIIEARVNCEMNSMLFLVDQIGGCCHEGYATCYYRALRGEGLRVIEKRVFDPKEAYGPKGRVGAKGRGKFTGR